MLFRSSITNFEINPQIRDAYLNGTVSEDGESTISDSHKTTSTAVVSEKGRISSRTVANFFKKGVRLAPNANQKLSYN